MVSVNVRGGVSVWIGNKGVAGVDEVWLGGLHQLWAVNFFDFAVLVVFGRVSESEEDSTGGPGEFVAEWVVGVFWSWETTAV